MSAGAVLKLGERLSKLRAMSADEVISRVRDRLLVDVERQRHRWNRLAPAGRLRAALRSDLRAGNWQESLLAARGQSARRFLPGVHDRDRMRELFATTYQRERADTLLHAARAREHRFEFFGREFTYGPEIDWQIDPVTGQPWPSRFHADVPVHGGDVGYGDVKHVWELNRQQFLIDLAKEHFLTGNRDAVDGMQRLVRSWIKGNPYATGVNWSCALEPAFRVWSWLWAYHLTADALDDEVHVEWLQSLYDHGRFLAAHLEYYSSPYNHLMGEASALYALGVCFPEFRDAPKWASLGRSVLESRLPQQFYADGGSVEQSTFYHHATLGFYLLAALLARVNREELSPPVWAALERGLTFSTALMQPDGKIPEIGGADDGKPIRMEHLPFWDFRPYQAIGAVLFDRPDFKAAAGRFYEDALWLLGPAGYERFTELPAVPPGEAEQTFPASGYGVMRSDWSEQADYVCVDVGEQAAGMRPDDVPNSMHGHADCLSVIVWLGGRRVLVDSGLYAYNCGGEWEAHFRGTAAHNTARVDGRDQARHIGKMAWSHSYRATLEGRMADERQGWIVGSHDGYARGPEGVSHRRVVWRRPGGYVLVYDQFEGHGEHDLEVNYQFAPGVVTIADTDRIVFDGFAEIAWAGTGGWASDHCCGGVHPDDGWICSSLGVRQAAPRLSLRSRMTRGRASLLTVVASRRRVDRRIWFVRGIAAGQTLAAIQTDGGADWVAAAGLTEGGAIDTDALLAVCAIEAGVEHERSGVQASYLQVDTAALAQLTGSLRPVAAR